MKDLFTKKIFLHACRKTKGIIPFFMLPLLLFSIAGYSQQTSTIKGRITDEGGQPIEGASVIVKGLTNGVSTNYDGDFEISTASNSTLVVSSVAFASKEIKVNGKQFLNISLNRSEKDLGEIVVVGYGTQRKEAVTGSVASISGDKIREVPSCQYFTGVTRAFAGCGNSQTSSKPGPPCKFVFAELVH